jgi:glc operon protein GlcG
MSITLEQAQAIIAGAHSKARDMGVRVTVAVVDEGGLLKALGRMDGAPPLSSQIAEAKAVGCALWHREGDSLQQLQTQRPGFFDAVSRMVRVPVMPGLGSVLIGSAETVQGAVGVSGAAPEQDLECARAGLDSLR